MGLAAALNATVSALRAQGTAISAVSENIANSSTTAYKTRQIAFQALVDDTGNVNSVSGGVLAVASQDLTQTGQIQTTGVKTNMAINGQGFFVITNDLTNQPSGFTYSRNGNFSPDAKGYLVNDEGNYLLGQTTNNLGVVTSINANALSSLTPININAIQGAALPTSLVSEKMNLPADAVVGGTFNTSFEVFDSLGVSSTVNQTWTKTAANTWTMDLSNPVLTNDLTTTSGTISPATTAFTFDGNGELLTPATSPAITISGFTTGAADDTFTLNAGTVGKSDGITQFASNSTPPTIAISTITGDGVRFGGLKSVEISDSGLVTAVFDNGLRQPVFQIPIATFPNPSGLTQVRGSVYDENQAAGSLTLQNPNAGKAGSIVGSALESSTTEISEEFNKLIIAQQAYSAAAQIITTVKTLDDTLNSAVR